MKNPDEATYAHISVENEGELLEQRYISYETIFEEVKSR